MTVTVLAITLLQPPLKALQKPQPINKQYQVQLAAMLPETKLQPIETVAVHDASASQSKAKTTATNPQTPAVSGCEQAIAKVWPASLQTGARLVSLKESSLDPDQVGPTRPDGTLGFNKDGSRDYGCFQINDRAHPQFFAKGDWQDPVYNAQYALKIYQERGNWTAWYAVKGILW